MNSFYGSIVKGIRNFILYGVGYLLVGLMAVHPTWESLTLGTILNIIYHWIVDATGVKLP